ncbi:MAG: DUF2219 family protein, partial [Thermodesulfobacteriota bacterium]|nr:DUF2219 family protein [Thermodesulfobacteriota bacterium]
MPGARVRAVLALLTAFILCCPVPSGADQNAPKKTEELCTASFYVENDMMGGTDQHYTNALKATYLSKDLRQYANSTLLPKCLAEPIQRISEKLFSPGRWYNVGLSVGQDIYTPVNTRAEELQEDDRPYAGWSYISLALHAKNATVLDTFETSLG